MPLSSVARISLDSCAKDAGREGPPSDINALRRANDARELHHDVVAPPLAREDCLAIATRDGATVPIELYRPEKSPVEPRGAVLYLHGGGWVMCGLDTHRNLCRYLAARSGVAVVSVGYRLAPEHRFPTAPDDAAHALAWLAANAQRLGIDATRLVVAGDSAGGNLAAVLAQQAARGEATKLAAQALFYPSVAMGVRERFDSWAMYGNGEYLIAQTDAEFMMSAYLTTFDQRYDPRFSPLLATHFEGASPALIITAEYDPLRDEGEAYAHRLRQAGVPVELVRFEGAIHAFMSMAGAMPEGYRALDHAARFIAEYAGELRDAA